MDPNANLKEQRELIERMQEIDDRAEPVLSHEYYQAAARLVELVAALDQWLSAGGFLPDDWPTPLLEQPGEPETPRCPDCNSPLTNRGTGDDNLTYCDDCDREVL